MELPLPLLLFGLLHLCFVCAHELRVEVASGGRLDHLLLPPHRGGARLSCTVEGSESVGEKLNILLRRMQGFPLSADDAERAVTPRDNAPPYAMACLNVFKELVAP